MDPKRIDKIPDSLNAMNHIANSPEKQTVFGRLLISMNETNKVIVYCAYEPAFTLQIMSHMDHVGHFQSRTSKDYHGRVNETLVLEC